MTWRRGQISGARSWLAVYAATWMVCSTGHLVAQEGPKEPLQQARQLYLTGRYEEAAELYQSQREHAAVEAGIGLARCLAIRGRTDEARQELTAVMDASPEAVAAVAEKALFEWECGDHEAAQTLVDHALELDENCIPARWVQSQLLKAQGDYEGASRIYRRLLDLYNQTENFSSPDDLRWIGLAGADYARWNRLPEQFRLLVNELLPAALKLESDYWPAHLEAGRLFLEKHNRAEAARSLAAAQKINAASPDVLAAQAQLALESFDIDQARRLIARAKGIHPRHVESLLVEADVHFALLDHRRAAEVLEHARGLHPRHEPTLGRLAAAVALRDAEFDPAKNAALNEIVQDVTAHNPRPGEFYLAAAAALDQCRQYPAAGVFLEQAIEAMPQLVGPRAKLGLIQMRLAEEETARKLLEQAFQDDPFDVRTRNTLEVLDVLDTYETLETEHFLIRFDPRQDRVLAQCAADYLESIYPELTDRLGYAPAGKTLFEFFHDAKNTKGHGWFSARMVGLPQIHTIGACAGKMVALTSPTSMPQQPFNWARVLRHEFVHVINLQQTNFHVPHWFTEALAVRLEDLPRPPEWEVLLARRAFEGSLFNLADINLGFIRPQSSDDWTLAYCQAELYADHLVERFGEQVLAEMLNAYRDGLDTPEAIERSCGVSAEDVERSYTAFVRELTNEIASTGAARKDRSYVELRLEHQANPDDVETAAELAHMHLRRREFPQARSIAEKVVQAEPRHQLATYVLARLHLVTGERDQADKLLSDCLNEDDPQPEVLKQLASLRLQSKQTDEAVRLVSLGAKHQPRDLSWTRSLAAIALEQGDEPRLTQYLSQLAPLEADALPIRKKLAALAAKRNDAEEAARWATEVISIDVRDAAMHKLRAKSLATLGRHREAADAFRLAVMLLPRDRELWPAYLAACRQAGLADRAREAAQGWLEHHPTDAGARDAVEELHQ